MHEGEEGIPRDRRLHQLVWFHYVKSGREGGEHLQVTGLSWDMAAWTNLREEERGGRDEGASDGGGGVPLITREMLR